MNRQVEEALRNARPDVILCGGYNYLASWQALRWAGRNEAPFLLWSESTENDQRGGHLIPELLKQSFLRACDGFVVPGSSALAYVQQLGSEQKDTFVAPKSLTVNPPAAVAEAPHHGGGGSFGFLTLLPLFGAAGLRRRRTLH